jgi:hypothetical protein
MDIERPSAYVDGPTYLRMAPVIPPSPQLLVDNAGDNHDDYHRADDLQKEFRGSSHSSLLLTPARKRLHMDLRVVLHHSDP